MNPPRSWISNLLLGAICLLGVIAFAYPFFLSAPQISSSDSAHASTAPLIFAMLGPSLLLLMLAELSGGQLSPRSLAVLGILTALVAALRLPAGPGDTPTFFFLIILAGYVYGPRFGFLLGALGLLVSALITGGVGPWLPFQMFVTGWMGMGAGLWGRLAPHVGLPAASWRELLGLIAYGYFWGLLFGALMNLWFWPFSPPGALAWAPGMGLDETLRRYAIFYLTTSLAWDSTRAIGNVLLIGLLGRPILRQLRRFHARFQFSTTN